jgi:hypothetical protein
MECFCNICGKICKNSRCLSKHVQKYHNYTPKQYFDEFLSSDKNNKICPVCKQEKTKFGSILGGYRSITCSVKCCKLHDAFEEQRKNINKGRVQSKESVEKRIRNTDQTKKEHTRKQTLLNKYGVINISQLPEIQKKISIGNKGKICIRTQEHQQKIIESKRKNGTINHTDKTKNKLRKTIREIYESDDPPITIPKNITINGRGHKCGYVGNTFFRSSYEEQFLLTCNKFNIIVETAESKEFRVPYIDHNNIKRMYYPDFYLPEYDVIIEIKPILMLLLENNLLKVTEGMRFHNNYLLLTEEELFDNNFTWVSELEHFLFLS